MMIDIRWANLPANKKYFAVRIIATDLRGNQLQQQKKFMLIELIAQKQQWKIFLFIKQKLQ